MSVPKDTIVALLPKLSQVDLHEVIGRATLLAGKAEVSLAEQEVYDACRAEIGAFAPLSILRRKKHYSRFKIGAETVSTYLQDVLPGASRTQQRHGLRLLVRCTRRWIERYGRSAGPWVLGDAMQNISAIVDSVYPGYRDSGLLGELLAGKLLKE